MRQASTSNGLAYFDREDDEETRRKSIYIYIYFEKGIFYLLAIESISTSYKICTILFHYGKVEF